MKKVCKYPIAKYLRAIINNNTRAEMAKRGAAVQESHALTVHPSWMPCPKLPLLLHRSQVHSHLTLDAVFPCMVAVHMLVSSQGLMVRPRRVRFGQNLRFLGSNQFPAVEFLPLHDQGSAAPRRWLHQKAEVEFDGSVGCVPEKDLAECWMS